MLNRRQSNSSDSPRREMKSIGNLDDSFGSPGISRYGRSHKPKMQEDYVSTDKKVSAYLKLSPGNQIQYVRAQQQREPKKRNSPKKSPLAGSPRRGRPPKMSPKKEEDMTKIVVKTESQDPSFPVDGCEWMVGDLAWGRVGQHPFWPCMIALDPVQKIFTKLIKKGRATTYAQRFIHVQFFGDNGRRSWLNATAVMSFSGRDAFMQLGETIIAGMRKKEPKQTSAFIIKPAVIQVWEKAVQEAEDLIYAKREARVSFFAVNFPPPAPEVTKKMILEQLDSADSDSTPKQRGRKRKADQTPSEDESKVKQIKLEVTEEKVEQQRVDHLLSSTPRTIADRKKRQALLIQLARSSQSPPDPTVSPSTTEKQQSIDTPTPPETQKQTQLKRPSENEASNPVTVKKPKRKYTKKKLPVDFEAFSSKHFDRVVDDHPELNEKEVNKYLQKMWNEMDDTQKARYKVRLAATEKEESDSAEESSEVAVSSEEAENDDGTSPKSSSPPPLATPTQKPSTIKRNNYKNIFSGAKSEKVCHICEKAGETVRCRGPCQSFYHPQCVSDPPSTVTLTPAVTPSSKIKRGRPKKNSSNESISSSSSENSQMTDVSEPTSSGEKPTDLEVSKKETLEKPEVEVIEPEKTVGKARKGSKDSETSSEEGEGFRCKDCQEGLSHPCFVCHEHINKTSGEAKLYRCNTAYCGKVYHEECLKFWPQCSWRTNGNGKGTDRAVLTCPQHTCHTCASDNPGVIKARYNNDKLVRCVKCPTTYHHGNHCLPAGSEILTNSQIICPRHYRPPKKGMLHHVNAAWCFICASGGSLICCDLCPTAFHADCLNISTPPDGSYVCEDCQTGRFPLYGEIVWVKLGAYRWWPAQILFPMLIPDNILNLPHVHGEFAVKFFGSHDHYWINRGRVFLYQDGDSGKVGYKKSSVDHTYERAIKEASEAQRKCLEEKATRDAEVRPGMKPPLYVKLKTNRPVGNVRTVEMNLSSLTPCECDPKKDNPCAPDSDCLNRILLVECNPHVCPAGEKCRNQMFEKRLYPPLMPYHTQGRGWGLKTLVPLKKGDFVIEYVGEMIDEEEYKRRLTQMHENNEENFYFLTIDKDRLLDAGPKGNVARFMNHSCQPNCETQKWTVNGDTRVGLFALEDIPAETELVFNYNLESIGSDKKPCMCGAPNCSGFIGVKAIKNTDREESKEKKMLKKKKSLVVAKAHDEECFVCGEGGTLILCDGKHCVKGYHLSCLNKKQGPQGYWLCPWHQCNVCNKGRVQRCTFCVNSFCQEHAEGNIRLDAQRGLVCNKHDQMKDSKTTDQTPKSSDSNVKESSSKPESIPMAVDSDSSSNSSSKASEEIVINKELTNNNVLNTKSAQRRTRRSRSNVDELVNGSAEKLNKRKGRPSSVDEKLISSSTNSDKSHTIVKKLEEQEIQEKDMDTLQENITKDSSEIESGNISEQDVEMSTANILQKDIGNELDENTERMEIDDDEHSCGKEADGENKVEETVVACRSSQPSETSIEPSNNIHEEPTKSGITNGEPTKPVIDSAEPLKSNETMDGPNEPIKIIETSADSNEVIEKPVESSETTHEATKSSEAVKEPANTEETTDNTIKPTEITEDLAKSATISDQLKILENNESLVTFEKFVNDKSNEDNEPKTELETKLDSESEIIENQRPSELEENIETDDGTTRTEESTVQAGSQEESKTEESRSETSQEEETTKEQCKEILSENSEDNNCVEDTKSIELNLSDKEVTDNHLEDVKDTDMGKVPAENPPAEEMCNGKREKLIEEDKSSEMLDDDFELTYSDCSNDKIINNPESSIKLKVTECTDEEAVPQNINERENKSDLVNGIDQSSTMEVV